MLEPSMPKPSSKESSFQFADRIGNVVLQAGDVGEAQIQLAGIVLLGELQNFLRTHVLFSLL